MGFNTTMKESDSHEPLPPAHSGHPLRASGHADQNMVVHGPLLFRRLPWILDMSLCPREIRLPKAFEQAMLPANPGMILGISNANSFGVYPHTSFPSCLRFADNITGTHARLGYRSHAFGLPGWPFTSLDRLQLAGRTPGYFIDIQN